MFGKFITSQYNIKELGNFVMLLCLEFIFSIVPKIKTEAEALWLLKHSI